MTLNWAVPILVVGVVFWFVGAFLIRQFRLRVRGWTVKGHGRDEIAYEEHRKGEIVFSAELMGAGPVARVIRLPERDDWDSTVPSWARGRRDEILARIMQTLREPRYSYTSHGSEGNDPARN